MLKDDGASALARLRKTASSIAAREKQMARLQEEFRKLLIQSAEIAVDGRDLPDIVETIDEPLKSGHFRNEARKSPYKWLALIAAAVVLAMVFIPFPLFASGLGKVFPARIGAPNTPAGGEEALVVLAFDESQAISVKPGMPATVRFQSLPGRIFHGTVESVGASSPSELQTASPAIPPPDASHIVPFNAGVNVGILLEERPPEMVYGMEANTQIRYGQFQLGKWIMQTLAG